ncbi:sorting nexin-17 [Formica exsecta]|uniref:sorting nexin-17 n=1 Tax=Formica exsecta TaxID=72781 RepID=UPI001143293B|nr:sorting nexin-17 [Formica exsecta]XP_029662617.1 sorting nexin-17 [Formica exsecta]XP_029662618.1 sorting nexin-17 [Formica exsecta]XP_029662619.1 sorting nexin-17 [Formica exsecta]XP_029662620.1 sorting nexin-17 [Formica exsecta]XP_029662621.1 sorting nexin-17 [Formica exsecta]
MHFSIPDTQEFAEGAGNAYVGYNIHINGLFHCTVRYKQLYNLHVQLSKDLDMSLPIFPPKKFFPLTPNQQEERRLALEKYIQSIGQNVAINNSEILNGFLLNAQQETVGDLSETETETLDIFLMNGSKISLNVSTREYSGEILKKVYENIQLLEKYHSHFALFIIIQDELSGNIKILRKLQDFESPFITYKYMSSMGTKIVLRKSYWDTTYDLELLNDPVTLNLLYVQTAAEIRSGWILTNKDVQYHLENMQKSGNRKEYLNIARYLKYYGYIQFAPCYCDYPQHGSKILLAIGGNELNLRILSSKEHEIIFKVSRMRCWRITTIQNGMDHPEDNNECSLELSFEYLIARNELQWITIVSEQAILMSVCLQAMIDELLQKCVVGSRIQVESGKSWTYITRDGQSRITMGSPLRECANNNHSSKSGPIIKKLASKWSAVTSKKSDESVVDKTLATCTTADFDIVENNVFRMIGDDDL